MIRVLREGDAAEVVELLVQLGSPSVDPDPARVGAKLAEMHACGHVRVFGFDDGGRVVGMVTVGRIEGLSYDCRPFAVIENVVVQDSERRRGIGTRLVRRAIDQAQAWGCYKVVLETGSRRDATFRFYEGCGLRRGEKTAFIKRFS